MFKKYIIVPYSDKDEAKKLGAKWNPVIKLWFAPCAGGQYSQTLLDRFKEIPAINFPEECVGLDFVGEDRNFGENKLYVDLIPRKFWFDSIRIRMSQIDWIKLYWKVCSRANNTCEACGKQYTQVCNIINSPYLEVHDRWSYDPHTRIRKLERFMAMCYKCKLATQIGQAGFLGKDNIAEIHLANILGLTAEETTKHMREAHVAWVEKNKIDWTEDISILTQSGITLRQSTPYLG